MREHIRKFDIKKTEEFKATRKPTIINRPRRQVLCIDGVGDPNNDQFEEYVKAMYACAYAIKMGYKKTHANTIEDIPSDFVVPPLQGYWSISEAAQKAGTWTKDDLVFRLEIVMPDFVSLDYIQRKIDETIKLKKDILRVKDVYVGEIEAVTSCHILHIGPYDTEPESFEVMNDYLVKQGYTRTSKNHREIYLGDVRKSKPENLKTILEVTVQQNIVTGV